MAAELIMETPGLPLAAPDDETRLLERCRRGEPGAAESLVRQHTAAIYRLGLRLLGDPEEARDLTQDVFLRAFRHLDGFRGDASLRTWLLRIAANAARNRRRGWARSRRSATVPLEETSDAPSPLSRLPASGPGPDDALRARAIGRRLREALGELPDDFREAVVLRDIEGLDYRGIARVLGVRTGTVKSRIARGREMLRRRLEGLL